MNEGVYYLKLAGKVEGPYTIGQIYDLWAARKINSQTLFARLEEMDRWLPLAELTLTIAPPRPGMAKPPVPEPASTLPTKPRPIQNLRAEDYGHAFPTKSERTHRRSSQSQNYSWLTTALLSKLSARLEYLAGFCVAAGLLLATNFMLIYSASPDGKEVSQERLTMKQNGVIVGMGFVLMGGMLAIAYQIKQVSTGAKLDAANKSERKMPLGYSKLESLDR